LKLSRLFCQVQG